MSASVKNPAKRPLTKPANEGPLLGHDEEAIKPQKKSYKPYRGFIAGVFSGIAKLSIGHPFDTIKVRLQTSPKTQFRGPLDCLAQTLRREGIRGLYKGATPPLLGWMIMDSVMLGSLTLYRRLLLEHVFQPSGNIHTNPNTALLPPTVPSSIVLPSTRQTRPDQPPPQKLPPYGHGVAGLFAGLTVCLIATPVEHIKARLQTQYHPPSASASSRFYLGPLDCARKIVRHHGLFAGLYHGFSATLIFRSFFFFWWSSYDILTTYLQHRTSLSTPAVNFWAGGLSAQVFWLTSYPADVVKQRIMTDPLGGTLGDGKRLFYRWRDAAVAVGGEAGWRGYWRGFLPCCLRAFPANAGALVAFEGVMRILPE